MENIILLKSPKAWPEIFAFEHLKKIARWTVKARNLGLRQDPPFVQLPQEQFNH